MPSGALDTEPLPARASPTKYQSGLIENGEVTIDTMTEILAIGGHVGAMVNRAESWGESRTPTRLTNSGCPPKEGVA